MHCWVRLYSVHATLTLTLRTEVLHLWWEQIAEHSHWPVPVIPLRLCVGVRYILRCLMARNVCSNCKCTSPLFDSLFSGSRKPRLHDTAGSFNQLSNRVWQTGLTNTVWQPCWTNSCSFNRLSNRIWQTGCTNTIWQPCWTNSCWRNEQLFVPPVVKPGCTTGLTTGCIV